MKKMSNMKIIFFKITIFWLLTIPTVLFAASDEGLGDIAGNVVGVGENIYQFFRVVCIMASAGMLLGAVLKYQKHRKNPIIAKLSDVVMMVVISAALLVLAFIPVNFK